MLSWAKSSHGLAIAVVLASIAIGGCGHTLVLNSTPSAANVYYIDSNGARQGLLGTTPLTLNEPKDGGKRYLLELEKPGFVPHVISVDQSHPFGSETKIFVTLSEQDQEWFKTAFTGAFSTEASKLLNDFVELKTRIYGFRFFPNLEKNAQSVRKLESQMKSKFEGFSIFNALMGEFYFHRKNYANAIKYLEKAVELNPQDVESQLLLSQATKKKKK